MSSAAGPLSCLGLGSTASRRRPKRSVQRGSNKEKSKLFFCGFVCISGELTSGTKSAALNWLPPATELPLLIPVFAFPHPSASEIHLQVPLLRDCREVEADIVAHGMMVYWSVRVAAGGASAGSRGSWTWSTGNDGKNVPFPRILLFLVAR